VQFGVTERRACRVVGQPRSTQRLKTPPPSDDELALRAFLRDFAKRRPRWGWRRAAAAAKQAGWRANHKRIHRLWIAESLRVPYRKRKKPLRGIGKPVGAMCPIRPNVIWGRVQVVHATIRLNLSAGVSHVSVLRGRSFSSAAIVSSSPWE
jgi:putative transposase